MLPLGIDPSVSMCVICYLELVVWVYRAAHVYFRQILHAHTHTRMRKMRSLSL